MAYRPAFPLKLSDLIPEERPRRRFFRRKLDSARFGYHVYTKRFDEIVRPTDILGHAELETLHSQMGPDIERIAERYALEIRFHADRIAKAVLVEKCLVTLLIDNSGSLKGNKMAVISAWLAVLVEALQGTQLLFEVLGHTTPEWRGGKSRRLWIQNGCPENPGRLNDLRWIIYKSCDQKAGYEASNFALMNKADFLKENIDGEALLWAMGRQIAHKADRKMLIVFSDGAPVDDSTLAANQDRYLYDHLTQMVQMLETLKSPEQGAIHSIRLVDEKTGNPLFSSNVDIADPMHFGLAVLGIIAGNLPGP